jgi:hypothetical protein
MKEMRVARFEQPCSEIWQLMPFHPGTQALSFVEPFVKGGHFDAEKFWQHVSGRAQTAGMRTPSPRKPNEGHTQEGNLPLSRR